MKIAPALSAGLDKEGEMRTRTSVLFIALGFIMVLSACGSYQRIGVTGYAALKITHEEVGKKVNRMYDAGIMAQEDYEKIEIEYDKAAIALYEAGDVWFDMIEAHNLSRAEEYDALIVKVEKLMNSINKIVILYGGGY